MSEMEKWWEFLPEMTPAEKKQWETYYDNVNPIYRDEDSVTTFDQLYHIYRPLITVKHVDTSQSKNIILTRSTSSYHFRIYWRIKPDKFIVLDEVDLYGDVSYNWDYYDKIDDDDIITTDNILPEQLVKLTWLWTRDTLISIRKSDIFVDYDKLKTNQVWLQNFHQKYLPYTEDLVKIGKKLVK